MHETHYPKLITLLCTFQEDKHLLRLFCLIIGCFFKCAPNDIFKDQVCYAYKPIPKVQLLNLSGTFGLPLIEPANPSFCCCCCFSASPVDSIAVVCIHSRCWSQARDQTWIPGSIPLSVLLHSNALNASHEFLESKRWKKGHNNNIQRGLSFSCDEDGITCKENKTKQFSKDSCSMMLSGRRFCQFTYLQNVHENIKKQQTITSLI